MKAVKQIINEYINEINNTNNKNDYERYKEEKEAEFLLYDNILVQFKQMITNKKLSINYIGK